MAQEIHYDVIAPMGKLVSTHTPREIQAIKNTFESQVNGKKINLGPDQKPMLQAMYLASGVALYQEIINLIDDKGPIELKVVEVP